MCSRWTGREAELNRQLRQTSEAGHGVLTLDDLRNLGVTEAMVHSRKRSGRFIPVLRGVVSLPGTKLTEKGRARAATYAGGRRCCLSHRSALSVQGLVRDRGPVQVVRETGAGHNGGSRLLRSEHFDFAVERRQLRRLRPEEITVVEGIPSLTVEKALIGFAGEATDAEIGKALSQGERERILCWRTLKDLVATTHGGKGLGRLKREIENWDPAYADAGSEPEEDLLRLIIGGKLPVPSVNEPIGAFILDFLWK